MARIQSTTSAGVPAFLGGGGGPQLTLDALMARQRQIAQAAGDISANRPMTSPWQGAAYLGEIAANKINQGRADRALAEGRQGLAEAMSGVSMENGATADQIAQVAQYDPDMGMRLWGMAADLMSSRRAREQELADRSEQRAYDERIDSQRYIRERGDVAEDAKRAELQKIDAERRAQADEIADEERAAAAAAGQPTTSLGKLKRDLDAGLISQADYDAAVAKENAPPSSGVTINTGDATSKLRQKFDEDEGKNWAGYIAAGNKAAGLRNDMQLLDAVGAVAPQGPLPGALQKMFPGVNSAGAAFQSIVKRLAPQMRVEGSGATSDIEYQGMVDSLPALGNYPEANRLIAAMIKAKAAIDIERASVITQWRNGEPGFDDAATRTKLADINKRSIMSPELQQLISATATTGGAAGGDLSGLSDADLDAEIERLRATGGQ